jgi:hypothetical protein
MFIAGDPKGENKSEEMQKKRLYLPCETVCRVCRKLTHLEVG